MLFIYRQFGKVGVKIHDVWLWDTLFLDTKHEHLNYKYFFIIYYTFQIEKFIKKKLSLNTRGENRANLDYKNKNIPRKWRGLNAPSRRGRNTAMKEISVT